MAFETHSRYQFTRRNDPGNPPDRMGVTISMRRTYRLDEGRTIRRAPSCAKADRAPASRGPFIAFVFPNEFKRPVARASLVKPDNSRASRRPLGETRMTFSGSSFAAFGIAAERQAAPKHVGFAPSAVLFMGAVNTGERE